MVYKIVVHSKVMTEMHQHALSDFPNECVGFFYGRAQEDQKVVSEYFPLENSKAGDQRRRFEVSPLDYMKAEKHALEQDLDLLGVYHSHPLHPAKPSQHDLKQAVPVFSYIIASVTENKVEKTTSWRLNEELKEFEEEILTNN